MISPSAELDENYNEAIALGAFDMIASPSRRSDVQWIAIRAMHEDARRSFNKRRPPAWRGARSKRQLGNHSRSR